MIKVNSKIPEHGGNLNEEARRLGINKNKIIDASASIVPFKTPQHIQDKLINAIKNNEIRHYPDSDYYKLSKLISRWHQIDSSMVLPGNGASELFTWAAHEASIHGKSCIPIPSFSEYERALRCWSAPYIQFSFKLNCCLTQPQNFPKVPKSDVLWITNPHNPTGQLWSRKSIENLLDKYSLIICDEAFLPLVPNGEKQSLLGLINNHNNLIVIRSLTKLFAIAGLRLGYAVSQPERINRWKRIRDPWPLNNLAIIAGETIFEDQTYLESWIKKIHYWIKEEGPRLHENLNTIKGIQSFPSSVNFQLIKSKYSLLQAREKLAQNNILLRDCRSFKNLGENWLRISLQTKEDNHYIFDQIKNIIESNLV